MPSARPAAPSQAAVVAQVRHRINDIQDPCARAQGIGVGLVDMGMVVDVDTEPTMDGGCDVRVTLRTTTPACMSVLFFEQAVRAAVAELEVVRRFELTWGSPADWTPDDMSEDVRRRLAERRTLLLERVRAARRTAA